MSQPGRERRVWLFARDRRVGEAVAASAQSAGLACRRLDTEAIGEIDAGGGLLLIDLDLGLDAVERLVAAARDAAGGGWYVCAYGSHLDPESLRAMQRAGSDRVMSASRLIEGLHQSFIEIFPSEDQETA